jgi:radical SAM protein with 4Fe4S-binding SPASM domain
MKRFKKTYIEITNICNLACDFCPKTERPLKFMNRELFEEILIKIQGSSEYIYFHVMGEPFLHPDLAVFLSLCQKYGYRVNITTNGTLIDKVTDSIISEKALRQVNFSLHSFEANTNEYPMDSYLDKIFEFIRKARKERELLICLRLWNLSDEGKNIQNKYILKRVEQEFKIDYTIENNLTPCRGIKLGENIFLNQAEIFTWPDLQGADIGSKGFCYGLRDQIAVLVDGTVVPCCLDCEGIISLGNIREQDLNNIIQGERAQEFYESFSRREVIEPLCRKCGYRSRFKL